MWQASCPCEKCHRISVSTKSATSFEMRVGGLFHTHTVKTWLMLCFPGEQYSWKSRVSEWCGSSLSPLWQHELFYHAQGEAGPAHPAIAGETILLPRALGARHFESRGKRLRVVFNPKVVFWPSLVSSYVLSGSSSTIFWLVSPEGWLCGRRLR